jgi:hypothetical protein
LDNLSVSDIVGSVLRRLTSPFEIKSSPGS